MTGKEKDLLFFFTRVSISCHYFHYGCSRFLTWLLNYHNDDRKGDNYMRYDDSSDNGDIDDDSYYCQ